MIKHYVIVLASLTLTGLLMYTVWIASSNGSTGSGLAFGIGAPLLLAFAAFATRPIKNQIATSFEEVQEQLFSRGCRIFIYGHGRTGKTTLIGGLVAIRTPPQGVKTEERRVYKVRVLLDFQTNRYVSLQIQDYKGQTPADAFFPDERFVGSMERPRVHILLFLVDLFDDKKNENGPVMSDKEIIDYYSTGAEAKIRKRVQKNIEYANAVAMQAIVARLLNRERLVGVLLVINKIDILQALIDSGKLRTKQSADEYAKSLYARTADHLSEICMANNLSSVQGVWCVSARQGFRTRNMFADLFDKYLGMAR